MDFFAGAVVSTSELKWQVWPRTRMELNLSKAPDASVSNPTRSENGRSTQGLKSVARYHFRLWDWIMMDRSFSTCQV